MFPGALLDDFFNFTISFAFPFVVLNYFLIIYNNRYEKLIKKYGEQDKRYALIYSMTSVFGAFVVAILYGSLTGTI